MRLTTPYRLTCFRRAHKHHSVPQVTAFLGTLFLGVLMGILVAVGLSLIIVIYESARPQITILWRIPGTSIYRNMKQDRFRERGRKLVVI